MANTYVVYFSDSGVAATGLTPTWDTLKRVSDGADQSQPSISEVGGGWYKYTTTIPVGETWVGVINGGVSLGDVDRFVPIDMRENDFDLDKFEEIFVTTKFDEDSDSLTLVVFMLRDGKLVESGITNMNIKVFTEGHVLQFDLNETTPINGVFVFTKSSPGLVKNTLYYAIAIATEASGTIKSADSYIALE